MEKVWKTGVRRAVIGVCEDDNNPRRRRGETTAAEKTLLLNTVLLEYPVIHANFLDDLR